ncbi:hypothetical protein [Desulfobacula sp.]|uniref:hypothetical protein n=1 Tax=Desulfobacula sp. TaxID=2593537 RepID=UPI00262D9CC1|nr:hypothetical protein [Desulfobacula sp.]
MKNEEKREISIFLWFTGCLAAVYVLGFLVAIPVFLFLFLKFGQRKAGCYRLFLRWWFWVWSMCALSTY